MTIEALAATLARPAAYTPTEQREPTLIELLAAAVARACLETDDPHRAMSGAVGHLLDVQTQYARGKRRRTDEELRDQPAPHRPKRPRRASRSATTNTTRRTP